MQVEFNTNVVNAPPLGVTTDGMIVAFTPPINSEYWLLRVRLTDKQSIVAFPKFFTLGVGFQVEDTDWNCNLPYTGTAEEIYRHISDNKGDDSISDETCITAIQMIKDAIERFKLN